MNLAWTGILLHEIISLGIIALFTVHLLVNRQWIINTFKRLKEASRRIRTMFYLNILLAISMSSTILSGILISQYLLSAFASSNIDLWYSVHTIASWLTLGVTAAHSIIHWRWIQGIFSASCRQKAQKKLRQQLRQQAVQH